MLSKIAIVLTVCLFSQTNTKIVENKAATVDVDVYYSPYDANSIKFLKKHLEGETKGIWDLMMPTATAVKVNFYPWGTAKSNTDCPGEKDCLATKLHACAIKLHQGDVLKNHQVFHFIVCTTNHTTWNTDPKESVNQCVNQINEWPDEGIPIDLCPSDAATVNGYLAEMKAKTDKLDPKLTKSPVIVVAGKRPDDAVDYLKYYVCNGLDTKPDACKTLDEPVTETPISTTTESSAVEIISSKLFSFALIFIAIIAIL